MKIDDGDVAETIVEENIIPIKNEDSFFTIEKLMSNYYLYIRVGNKTAVSNILTENYKNNNSISDENVIEKAKNGSGSGENFYAREIYYKDDIMHPSYLVYGIIEENKTGVESYAIVYVDNEDSTYSVEPISKETYNNYKNENATIPTIEAIPSKDYNNYTKATITEEDVINNYFERYVKDSLYYTEYAYSKLNEEYKNAKFPTLQEYQAYVNNKSEELKSFLADEMKQQEDFATEEEYMEYLYNYETKGVERYNIQQKDDYTQYTIIDDNGNYYIIYATSPMNYTIILDTYTIDLPEFTEQYSIASEEGKVQLNLQRFFDAINDENYEYAYSKLDETYKNNNFPTQADFENYMKTTFYTRNTLAYTSYEKNGEVYVYRLVVRNYNNENETVEKQFVVKLLEGTDFAMSFEK